MIFVRTFTLLVCVGLSPVAAAPLQETWQTGYEGQDATGPHVLGYWKFSSGAELKDSSGRGHDLKLSGATLGIEGQSGSGLKCEYAPTKSHSVKTEGNDLSPPGPFSLEMWVRPNADDSAESCYLVDKRYTPDNHTDYSWMLMKAEKSGLRRMSITLGFGSSSETFHSEPVEIKADDWQHLAVTYDAMGTVTFYRNGSLTSQSTRAGLGAVRSGTKPLHIGDRVGSTYSGFPGIIDSVRLSRGALRFENVDLQIRSDRRVWQRMEKAKPLTITCTNLLRKPISGARLVMSVGTKVETVQVPPLDPGESHDVTIPVDTTLKPATYTLSARLEHEGTTVEKKKQLEVTARPVPAMPVVLWGGGDIPRMKDIGFTHYMALGVDNMGDIWKSRQDVSVEPLAGTPVTISRNVTLLDDALSAGIQVIARVSPRGYAETLPGMLRVGRDGKPLLRKSIIALNPELPPFFGKVGRSLGKTYGHHPAFSATLVNTEVRDASQPSFSPLEIAAYREFSGTDIPAEVQSRGGVDWQTLTEFPENRVIPDDHPVLNYYRWFWTTGDGWSALHTALSDGVKATSRPGHWTFHDPAVRQPAISGGGGNVDVLSHWTYTYPEPQRIGLATDQLLAMSEASGKNQGIMKMTQLIWYRSQTAPVTKNVPNDPVPWVDQDPDAAYITISPMHLREALWTKLSRPISGIMYHGWQSLVPTQNASAYKFTNPNTVHVLKDLIHDVVQPLGPTLMAIPDERAEVAFLESFTAQMFSKRGGYGYNNNWPTDVWLALQHAHVRTDILYEETLLKKGLEGRSFLVMPHCDVLTESVVNRIRKWQQRGGKIIADENLCPALKADILLPAYKRTRNAAADRTGLLAMAKDLSSRMTASGHVQIVKADTPDAILRMRSSGDARYLFVINDRREAGNYVGQNGLVLENGLPTRVMVTLPQDTGYVYDLSTRRQLQPLRSEEGGPQLPVDLGPCDGRIFMLLPTPLQAIDVDLPESVERGATMELRVRVTSSDNQTLKAVIPLKIRIRDANGKEAEFSGYYAAKDGTLSLPLSVASNEDPGSWEIRITELASGLEATRHTKVQP
jgi:hypothetical protein